MRNPFRIALILAGLALAGCPAGLNPSPPPDSEHWLRFVQITDIHILDQESPGRAVRMEKFLPPSWRPQEAYTTQVLDATLRQINALHYEGMGSGKPVDFVLASGDLVDNAQYNELRWFIDTMDGKRVTPDSGALDGPLRTIAAADNPHLPFQANGLAKDIPWYVAIGNHDNLSQGNFAIDRTDPDPINWTAPQVSTAADLLGLTLLTPPQTALIPTLDQSPAIILASDPDKLVNPYTFQLDLAGLVAGPIPADPNRHYISRNMFIHELFNTITMPLGHGFSFENEALGLTRYTVRFKTDIPVRMIVLDSQGPDTLPGVVAAQGAFTVEQFENFMKPAIKAAQDAQEFVIIVTHHPTDQWTKAVAEVTITGEEFRGYLASQPNIIAHFCGHMHYNKTTLVPGQYPYYEIQTSSLIDYPQEARMIDIDYDRANKQFYLQSQIISHADAPTHLSQESFRRATTELFEDPLDYDYSDHVNDPPPPFETYVVSRPDFVPR